MSIYQWQIRFDANEDLSLPFWVGKSYDEAMRLEQAWRAIVDMLAKRGDTFTGGSRAFYGAREWAERGETHGRNSPLIIVHDGGELGRYCDPAKGDPESLKAMVDVLEPLGFYVESQTCWYSAIYERKA